MSQFYKDGPFNIKCMIKMFTWEIGVLCVVVNCIVKLSKVTLRTPRSSNSHSVPNKRSKSRSQQHSVQRKVDFLSNKLQQSSLDSVNLIKVTSRIELCPPSPSPNELCPQSLDVPTKIITRKQTKLITL